MAPISRYGVLLNGPFNGLQYADPYPGCEVRLTEEHVDAATLACREVLQEHLGTELYRSDDVSSRQLDAH